LQPYIVCSITCLMPIFIIGAWFMKLTFALTIDACCPHHYLTPY
jgi:hypothetical protein